MRNPTWTEDELVLALDLYFRLGRHVGDTSRPEVIQLSTTLNSLPVHPASVRSGTFRDPAGVSMKLGNISQLDEALVATNQELVTRFEKKIQATLARIWGEEEPTPGKG